MLQQHEWQPGHLIAGRYRLEAPLGRGGMGAVWRAEHLTLNSAVAIKLVTEPHGDDDEARARFLLEAQAAAALRGAHVVQILDYGLHEQLIPYIVMELLEGETLAQRLARGGSGRRRGRLAPSQVFRILTHVARALGKAHELGIIHRDLKPDNVFLAKNDDEEIAKVLDFGIAKVPSSKPSMTDTGGDAVLGTPSYMSPEQIHGNRPVDWRTDLWSMGVIAFECLCARLPFPATATGELVLQICSDPLPVASDIADVPPEFDRWFERAASRDPERRFQSAKELAEAFGRVFVGGGWHPKLSGAPIEELVESDRASDVEGVLPQRLSLDLQSAVAVPRIAERAGSAPPAEVGSGRTPERSTASIVARAAAASFFGAVAIAAVALSLTRSQPERSPTSTRESVPAAAPPLDVARTEPTVTPPSQESPVASATVPEEPRPSPRAAGLPSASPSAHPAASPTVGSPLR